MNELTTKAAIKSPAITTLPESLAHWQRCAGRLSGIPELPTSQQVRQEVLQGLKQALWASGPDYVATSLARLQGHYWRPDFSEAQARELYLDFIEDLGELPPDILDEAIRQYRRDPEAKFFPRSGDLLTIAKPILEERRRAVSRLEQGPERKPVHPTRSPAEIARVQALVKRAFHRPDLTA